MFAVLKPWCVLFGLIGLGFVAGIYVQHRWPLGRVRDEWRTRPTPAPASLATLQAMPAERRLVLLVCGQSHAGNYGTPPANGGAGVYAFADHTLFVAKDPLPGGDGYGGSIWSRLGALLRLDGRHDAVVFAIAAEGSTRVADWAPGGRLHPRLEMRLQELATAGLTPDAFLWLQGETDAWDPATAGADHAEKLVAVLAAVRRVFPNVPAVLATSTYGRGMMVNTQVRAAVRQVAGLPGNFAGPDLDLLGEAFRSDGVHLNAEGLEAAAQQWQRSLDHALARSSPPVRP